MGEVFQAKDPRLNRLVAIKVLPADKVADPERKRRFIQEAQAASALSHTNMVTLHDIARGASALAAGRATLLVRILGARVFESVASEERPGFRW